MNILSFSSFSYLQLLVWMLLLWRETSLKMLYHWLRRWASHLLCAPDRTPGCTHVIICFFTQMVRLQNSVVFRAVSELDFQQDMVGSINMLMCSRQQESNSSNMYTSLRSPKQMANRAGSAAGNISGEFYSTYFQGKLLQLYLCLIPFPELAF